MSNEWDMVGNWAKLRSEMLTRTFFHILQGCSVCLRDPSIPVASFLRQRPNISNLPEDNKPATHLRSLASNITVDLGPSVVRRH